MNGDEKLVQGEWRSNKLVTAKPFDYELDMGYSSKSISGDKIYIGQLKNSIENGQGRSYHSLHGMLIYKGGWKDGKFCGYGKSYLQLGFYSFSVEVIGCFDGILGLTKGIKYKTENGKMKEARCINYSNQNQSFVVYYDQYGCISTYKHEKILTQKVSTYNHRKF